MVGKEVPLLCSMNLCVLITTLALQALDDMLVMRKKNLDHREFDMRTSSDHGESAVSAQMAELADR